MELRLESTEVQAAVEHLVVLLVLQHQAKETMALVVKLVHLLQVVVAVVLVKQATQTAQVLVAMVLILILQCYL
jgi:hypothetical protein